MAVVVKDTGTYFPPAPEGVHQAVCIDVIDKGEVEMTWNGSTRSVHKVVLRWALEETDDEGRQYQVQQWYTASLNAKANLRKHLDTWRGRAFTAEELTGFDLEAVVGANCQLVIHHSKKADRTYANVMGITPTGKGASKLEVPADYVRMKDRPENGNGAAPAEQQVDEDDEDEDLPF